MHNLRVNHNIKNSMINYINEVLLSKQYKWPRSNEYLERMYEGIDDNPIITNALYKIKNNDECTLIHSINTSFYSTVIAIGMGLNHKQVINATQAGLLHDIGKIYIPDEILNKREKLDEVEYEIMKKHTLYGYFLLNEFGGFNLEVRRAVLFHHERIDSTGYPLGASTDYVGFISKIVAVADVYEAMTTDRIYKKGVSPAKAMNFLCSQGMEMLDNEVINVLRDYIYVNDFR